MINGAIGTGKSNSLMSEYSSLLSEAVLRHRARVAETTARLESDLARKVKSEFIGNMSHELRTPLNTIIGFSKFLGEHDKRKLKDAEIVEYSRLINEAADRLLTIINDILDISKIQSGGFSLDSREVNMEAMLRSCLASFQSAARDAGVELGIKFDHHVPMLRGDTVKLRQVFTNLVGNAIKFTRQGGSVQIEAQGRANGAVMVHVRDSGVGMTEDEISIALTPFGQVDSSRSRWREGAGLGLPIAKALVELHGGKLEIKSTKDVGTEVTVLLPQRSQPAIAHGRGMMIDLATLQLAKAAD